MRMPVPRKQQCDHSNPVVSECSSTSFSCRNLQQQQHDPGFVCVGPGLLEAAFIYFMVVFISF